MPYSALKRNFPLIILDTVVSSVESTPRMGNCINIGILACFLHAIGAKSVTMSKEIDTSTENAPHCATIIASTKYTA